MQDRLTLYAERIHDVYPDMVVATIRLIDQGQNNDVIVLNEGLILGVSAYPPEKVQLAVSVAEVIRHQAHP